MREYGIDPIIGHENLVWAPMRVTGQHSTESLEFVVNSLKEKAVFGDRDLMVIELRRLGVIASGR
ncbi:hypothetical protein [Butyrivibrio fibrisolvens]|uniref:Uncharacterized protein n=1 Tax=Butyrivibrio fibrisolvens TaxID=831 RepID=A0A317G1W6_BUTFI|nr:hypothetical protein [Butyrivibrio fibrisolvens]PWT27141.1 hypothetical protein CPT75_08510 [Butyrivibrio fibrisolvens]